MEYSDIIVAPVLTEKSTYLREEGKYIFKVNPVATKVQIKEAVRRLFNVRVLDCTVMNVKGKTKRLRYKSGKTAAYKKAIVKLAEGETIKIFEGV